MTETIDTFLSNLIEQKEAVVHAGEAPGDVFSEIVSGRRFQSDNMNKVAGYRRHHLDDFDYVRERLFRTKKGAFLLVGEGHGCTAWRFYEAGGCGVGHAFLALTAEEARRWLELRGLTDDLEKLFGADIENA